MFVDEAHRLGKQAAAHAIGWDGIDAALRVGFNSIEHGGGLTPDLMDRMVKQNVYWCPTIFVVAYVADGRGGIWPTMVEIERKAFGEALKRGVKIAYGTDAGGYAWTEHQAQELDYMVRYGMTPMQASSPRPAPPPNCWASPPISAPQPRAAGPTSSPSARIRSRTSRRCSGWGG
jgi:imidazolonepropionase-like amidohydrolase